MGDAELRVVFKLINSPENKKVLDDNKNDIQRSIAALGATSNKDILKAAFGSASSSFIARNPHLFTAAADAGKKTGEAYSRGFIQTVSKFGGGKDLAKVLSLPDINDLTRGTIKGLRDVTGKDLAKVLSLPDINDLTRGTIKGLRDVTGKDLAKVNALGDINDLDKYKGATPPKLADVERERLKKMGLGVITAMFNPWIGSRLLSDAVATGGGAGGKGGSIARGIFGSGGAFGFSEFYIAITAIKKALQLVVDALKWGAEQIKKAIDFAHKLYGESLQSGLSLKFTAMRQATADVLGVPNDNQIFRYKQSAQVMAQLSDAVNKIARTAPDLAYLSAQFKILQYNVLADASVLADKLTPALDGFVDVMEKLLKLLENSKVESVLESTLKGFSTAYLGQITTFLVSKGISVLGAIGKADLAANGGGFGQPQSFMKQLPAGAFEKMGLIIGGGMADKALEYQRRTAVTIEKLYQLASKNNSQKSGYYMNRNPMVAGY